MPILDSHAHLWRRAHTPQPWIDPGSMAAIDADFWTDDLARMQAAAGIEGAIVVQSGNDLAETRDLLAASDGVSIRGVVGWISLEGDVHRQVAALREGPGGSRLVGIRHLAHQDPDPLWLTGPGVASGLEALGAIGLPFDLVVLPTQLALAARAIENHPSVSFVLDHLGKPPIAAGGLPGWRDDLASVASSPNVVAKVSGLTMEADWSTWAADDIRPCVAHALEVFGPDRLLFGTDWPLVTLQGGAAGWLAVAQELLPREIHGAVFADNIVRTYLNREPPMSGNQHA